MIYFAESDGHCIRRFPLSDSIVVRVVASCGSAPSYAGDGGMATSALISTPIGLVVDTSGVLYYCENGSNRVRTVDPTTSIITTYAGTGDTIDSGSGPATSAAVYQPWGLWLDSLGQIYLTSVGFHTVNVISSVGILSTVVGGSSSFIDGGPATSSALGSPERVFADSAGTIYVGDTTYHRIRVVSGGIITTLIGTGATAYNEGIAGTSCNLFYPSAVVVDSVNGDVYVSSKFNYRVQVLTKASGLVTNFAGIGFSIYSGDGGAATDAGIKTPDGLYLDSSGKLFIADFAGYRLRVVYSTSPTSVPSFSPSGMPSHPPSVLPSIKSTSAPSIVPSIVPTVIPSLTPSACPSVAPSVSSAPSLLRSDVNTIYTIAGTGNSASSASGGAATATNINFPRTVWEDTIGVVYFVESGASCVRKFTLTAGIVSNVIGVCTSGASTSDGNLATNTKLNFPIGFVVDTAGKFYVGELSNQKIRLIPTTNIVSTFAGNGEVSDSGNGGPATSASIYGPAGIWLSSQSQLYVACYGNSYVRVIGSDGIISLVAGIGTASYSGDGGLATNAALNRLERVFVDTNGRVYAADSLNHRVRVVAGGIINTLFGTGSTANSNEGIVATSSNVNYPSGIVVDFDNGDVYVSSKGSKRIYVLTATTGRVTNFVGDGNGVVAGDGGAATSASLSEPDGLYLDTSNKLFVSDDSGNRVRLVTYVSPTLAPTASPTFYPTVAPSAAPTTAAPSTARSVLNNIITIAGTGSTVSSGSGGAATAAGLNEARTVWASTLGVLYFSEAGASCIRKFSLSVGIVSNVAGMCSVTGDSGDGGLATAAKFNGIVSLGLDTTGTIYFGAYYNNKIRKISSSSIITTYAGTGTASDTGNGGAATSATIREPHGLWIDSIGQVYVSCYSNAYVRFISSTSIISLVAGTGTSGYSGDGGPATSASLNGPERVLVDTVGVVYFTDSPSNRVRSISLGIVTTIVGTGSTSFSGEGSVATSTNLNYPSGLCIDNSNGDLYLSSGNLYRVLVLTKTTARVHTHAGNGDSSSNYVDDVAATSASIGKPQGIYLDSSNNMYLADTANFKLRAVYSVAPSLAPTCTPSFAPTTIRSSVNNIYTIAGSGSSTSSGLGGFATAAGFSNLISVWEDTAGTVYTVESDGNCVRKFAYSVGILQSSVGICGTAGFGGDGGPASSSSLNSPRNVVADSVGSVFITDVWNLRIRTVSTAGIISTVLGNGAQSDTGDGGPGTSASIAQPSGLWVSSVGTLYVTGWENSLVRRLSSSQIVSLVAGASVSSFYGDGGPATRASLNHPEHVMVDSSGLVYVSDTQNNLVRFVSLAGIISTIVGTGTNTYNGENVAATSSNLCYSAGLSKDNNNGDLYISTKCNQRVVVMTASSGLVSTYAGSGTAGTSGDGGPATSSQLYYPRSLCLDSSGKLFIAHPNMVRMVYTALIPSVSPSVAPTLAPSAIPSVVPTLLPSFAPTPGPTAARSSQNNINTVVGTGTATSSAAGSPASATSVHTPRAVWSDTLGFIYFSESGGACVRKYGGSNNIVVAVAGVCLSASFSGDGGMATSAKLMSPSSGHTDTAGVTYFSDCGNRRIRMINNGIINTVVGTGISDNTGNNGPATAATLANPIGMWVNSLGVIFVGDNSYGVIRSVNSASIISLFAGKSSNIL